MKTLSKSIFLACLICISTIYVSRNIANAQGQNLVDKFLEDTTKDYISLKGSDRMDTSRLISKMAYTDSENIIIVDGSNYVDSMSAIQVSAHLQCPILLNSKKGLDKDNKEEMIRLKVKNVYIIGSKINPKLGEDLSTSGYKVTSISGDSPFDLSYKCVEFANKNVSDKKKTLILASSEVFADSLSISTYSYTNRIPMLLVNKDIDDNTAKLINSYGAEDVIVIGGENSITKASMEKIANSRRISGQDRYKTSRIIQDNYFKGSKNALVSSGLTFADTVAASPLASAMKANIVLVRKTSEEVHDYHFNKVIAVGGLVKKYLTDVVYINPHQDDETIDMGLDIIRDVRDGRKVYLILMTDGSMSKVYDFLNHEFTKSGRSTISRKDFVYLRNMEMLRALDTMGVKRENIFFTNNINLKIDKDTVIKSIEKFEKKHGENFSYKTLAKNEYDKSGGNKDHFACHDGVKEFCEKNSRNYTFYSSQPMDDDIRIQIRRPNHEEAEIWAKAFSQYGLTNPSLARYGVGHLSVGGIINRRMENLQEFIDYN